MPDLIIERGEMTMTPGLPEGQPADGTKVSNAELRALGKPTGRLDAESVGERELVKSDVKKIVAQSSDFEPGTFQDGEAEVGDNQLASEDADFSAEDVDRIVMGDGIPPGTKINIVFNGALVELSQDFTQEISDGVISAGNTLTSNDAEFTAEDDGRVLKSDNDLNGRTITFVSASVVTFDGAAIADATDQTFQIGGRTVEDIQFTVVGRGKGYRLSTDAEGVLGLEVYSGFLSALIGIGNFQVDKTGRLTIGGGLARFTVDKDGNASWGVAGQALRIDRPGVLFAGGDNFAEAVSRIDNNGDTRVKNTATSNHQIDIGAVTTELEPVTISPNGGAFAVSIPVTLFALTQRSRIYYRLHARDGKTINADPTFESATGGFVPALEGREIVGTNIPPGTRVLSVTDGTHLEMTANAGGAGTNQDWYIVPDVTDTLYEYGNPIVLTANKNVVARAYKTGEYSDVAIAYFENNAGVVSNPEFGLPPGTYPTTDGTLVVPISCATAAAKAHWRTDGVPTDTVGTLIDPLPGDVTLQGPGEFDLKVIAHKIGLANSAVVTGHFSITIGGNPPGGGGGGGEGGTPPAPPGTDRP